VVSGLGKMGREILAGLQHQEDIEVVGVLEKFTREEVLSLPDGSGRLIPCSPEPSLLERLSPDAVVDFSNHEWTAVVAPIAIRAGVRPVVGTTGLPEDLIASLERDCAAAHLGGVVASNFALGAVLLTHLARVAAPFFDNVEIIELHHDQKVDAPSGTSLTIADALLGAREQRDFTYPPTTKETIPGTRGGERGGAGIHSVRLPGLVAHHEVIFGGLGQTLTLRHDSTSRESFLPGVLLATREVMQRQELVRGLDRLMGLA
jgi:4-hydroxy-tetrahydrodipicolinate reductase